ncbi:hypothetical protein ACROYT_G015933 [Oculina patagonica]
MLATGKWLEKRMGHQQLQVKLNATELDQVNSQKLLGVTIDSKLSFDEHIDDLCRKVSQRIAVLKRIKKFLPFQQRIAYYNAMIKQDMLYASVVWSSCSLGNLQRILRLQKRAARVILDADTRANSVELFKILNWLPVHVEVKINILTQVYKRINGQSPSYMNELLVPNSEINERNSRYGSVNLACPRFKRKTEGGRSFSVRATRLWNTLPNFLKKISKINVFSTTRKKIIYGRMLLDIRAVYDAQANERHDPTLGRQEMAEKVICTGYAFRTNHYLVTDNLWQAFRETQGQKKVVLAVTYHFSIHLNAKRKDMRSSCLPAATGDNHIYLSDGVANGYDEDTLFTLCLTALGAATWNGKDRISAIRAEAEGSSKEKVWCGMFHLMVDGPPPKSIKRPKDELKSEKCKEYSKSAKIKKVDVNRGSEDVVKLDINVSRKLTCATVERWKNQDLAQYDAASWLIYDSEKTKRGQYCTALKCKACIQFESMIKNGPKFSEHILMVQQTLYLQMLKTTPNLTFIK